MLDKSRPYATVSGFGEKHRFEQDGKKFDATGQEIGAKPKAPENPKTDTIENHDAGSGKPPVAEMPMETRLLIIDKNANGYLSIKEIKAALTAAKVEFNPRNNSRKFLIGLLKGYLGVN